MDKRIAKQIKTAFTELNEDGHLFYKLMVEQWNNKTPHFGGNGPHRYDGTDKKCCYCLRPIKWKPVNAGYYASEILYGGE